MPRLTKKLPSYRLHKPSGQAIVTGGNGRAQVKFTDGGLISLQPNTEWQVEVDERRWIHFTRRYLEGPLEA